MLHEVVDPEELSSTVDPAVLVGAIRDGLGLLTWARDSFAYVDGWDEEAARYRGLRGGQVVGISEDDLSGLLVRPDVAQKQQAAETPPPAGAAAGASAGAQAQPGTTDGGTAPATGGIPGAGASAKPKRFHGTVTLDPTRVGRDVGRIADEVIAHLVGLVGSQVRVTLEVEAEVPSGVPDSVVRTVTENSPTLKFISQGFEAE
jgi:hypothetical protein